MRRRWDSEPLQIVDVQHRGQRKKRRGIVRAATSGNDKSLALQVLKKRPIVVRKLLHQRLASRIPIQNNMVNIGAVLDRPCIGQPNGLNRYCRDRYVLRTDIHAFNTNNEQTEVQSQLMQDLNASSIPQNPYQYRQPEGAPGDSHQTDWNPHAPQLSKVRKRTEVEEECNDNGTAN